MRHHQDDLGFLDYSVRDQEAGGSNPLAPTTFLLLFFCKFFGSEYAVKNGYVETLHAETFSG
jgi:hypothetical protein